MARPLWALAGLALLGIAGGAGILIASSGGEEEVAVQTQQTATAAPTATAATPAASPTPAVTPSPVPTAEPSPDSVPADWRTYSDAALGFSLRYPPDLIMSESGDAAQRGVAFKSPDEPSRSFVIAIVANSRGLTLEQWVSEYAACLPDTVQEGSIAGTAAIYCTSRPEELPEDAVAFQQRETMVLLTSILPPAEFQLVIESLRS